MLIIHIYMLKFSLLVVASFKIVSLTEYLPHFQVFVLYNVFLLIYTILFSLDTVIISSFATLLFVSPKVS